MMAAWYCASVGLVNVVVLVLLHHRLPRAHELFGKNLYRSHFVLA